MALVTSSIVTHNNDGSGTWVEIGAQSSSQNTDVFFSSTGSRAKKVSNSTKGFGYQVNATGRDMSAEVVCLRWATLAGVNLIDTRTAGGVAVFAQDTSGNISYWDVDGSDTYKGGWKVSVVDFATTPSRNNGTDATLTVVQYVGMVWIATGGIGGGDPNCYIDQVLSWPNTGIVLTGDSTSLIDDLITLDSDRGVWEVRSGQIFSKGRIVLTPGASDFAATGSNLIFENPVYDAGSTIDSAMTLIGMSSADSDAITFTRCQIISADPDEAVTTDATRSFDFASATLLTLDTSTISGFEGTVTLGAGTNTIGDTTFDGCGLVTDTGAEIRDCFFRNAISATGAYEWTENSDIDRCDFFSDGSGYGIRYRPTGAGPFNEAVDDFDFTGYGADESTDAGVHIFPVTTTVTITWSITNASEPTYDEDATYSGTFTSVPNPVTTAIHVNDEDGDDYTGQLVRVYVAAKDGTGPLPFEDVVTISNVTTTATVAHTAHGFLVGQKVLIQGCNETDYNGVSTITAVTASTYDYTMPGDPGGSATGSPISTGIIIDELTDATGDVSDQRVLSSDQPIVGWTRKGSATPFYQDGGIDDVISSTLGFSLTVKLVLDE